MVKENPTNLMNIITFRAVILIITGLILLVYPEATLSVLFFIMGAYWLIDGVVTAYKSFQMRKQYPAWTLGFFIGILGIVAGLVVVLQPGFASVVTTSFMIWFLGIAALIYGIGGIVNGIRMQGDSNTRMATIIGGLLSVIFAIIIISSPYGTFITIVKVLGIVILIGGLILGYMALRLRTPKE